MPQPAANAGTLLDYWIADFDFVSMDEFPDTSKLQLAVETRPGSDGHVLWNTGTRGAPTTITTFRDVLDPADGANTYANYVSLIGFRVNVMWAGNVYDHTFDILDVKRVKLKGTALGVGGRLGGSNGYLICQWTLLAVPPVPTT